MVNIIRFGSGGENRTPTNGFGDHRTAIILHRNRLGVILPDNRSLERPQVLAVNSAYHVAHC